MINLKLCLLLVLSIFVVSGCWSSRDLNELAIATAIGIDKAENGEYEISVQIINPSEIAGQGKTNASSVTIYKIKDKTLFEAIRRLTTEAPRKIYLSHLRVIVFGEELAREGIQKTLDFLSRDHEYRSDFYFLVAKNSKAKDIISILTPLENISANKIHSSLQMSEKAWAPTTTVTLDKLISALVSEGANPVLTGIMIVDEDVEKGSSVKNLEEVIHHATLKLENLSAFKGDKLVGWLNTKESKGYNYIKDNVTNTVGHVPCPDKEGNVVVEVIRSKTKNTVEVINGEPKVLIHTSAEVHIGEVRCTLDLTKPQEIHALEKEVNEQFKDVINGAVRVAQEDLKSDIFGFGELVHRANPKVWKKLKENWNDTFTTLVVDVTTDVKIRRTGTILDSFQVKGKE